MYYDPSEHVEIGIVLLIGMIIGAVFGGVVLGATLTAAKGVGLIYLNKGIMYGATPIGNCFGPIGTVVGFITFTICVAVPITIMLSFKNDN